MKNHLLAQESRAMIEKDGRVISGKGELHRLDNLDELRTLSQKTGDPIFFAIPFRTITEKGSEYQSFGYEPIIAIQVPSLIIHTREEVLKVLEDKQMPLELEEEIRPFLSRGEFAENVELVQNQIRDGQVCQTVISRAFQGKVHLPEGGYEEVTDEMFARVLAQRGQYMTLLLETGESTLVGLSPECHLRVEGKNITMNPIAGTMRKGDFETFEDRLFEFLSDPKEINELSQVLDEELKMMARICPKGGRVRGPFLRETGAVIHTEYLIEGVTDMYSIEALRHTLQAPTLVGGPAGRASVVLARVEGESRRYYGGEVGILHPNGDLDSCITIRTAEVLPDGQFSLRAGAGIVRDSVPIKEAEETEAKAAGLLNAIKGQAKSSAGYLEHVDQERLYQTLFNRNQFLSPFHMEDQSALEDDPRLAGKRITIVHNEDDFAYMLAHMAGRMGCQVEVVDTFAYDPDHHAADITILGPGPGNINDHEDERMLKLMKITKGLQHSGKSVLGICLGHQALAKAQGMSVEQLKIPQQGIQREVELFGKKERIACYNSFAPHRALSTMGCDPLDEARLNFQLDDDGSVLAMKGERMMGFQFHPESVMTKNGYSIMKDSLVELVAKK